MADKFAIKAAATAGEPAEPTASARPTIDIAPIVQYPTATRATGQGRPAGFIGKPTVEFGRPRIPLSSAYYYQGLFPGTTTGSALVKAKLYDPWSNTWQVYQGIMWRPTYDGRAIAGLAEPELTNFRVRITELTASSW